MIGQLHDIFILITNQNGALQIIHPNFLRVEIILTMLLIGPIDNENFFLTNRQVVLMGLSGFYVAVAFFFLAEYFDQSIIIW